MSRLTKRFSDALSVASELHRHQLRKGTTIPYVAHLLAVSSIALHHGATEDEAIAALLHDAIEDAAPSVGADWVRELLRSRFGEEVLAIVEGCTDTDEQPKPPWRERKRRYIAHLAEQSSSVLLVSASDKLHNAGAILADYRHMGDSLWSRFNQDAGKTGTIAYYRALVTAYQQTGLHQRLVSELDLMVSSLEQATGMTGARLL